MSYGILKQGNHQELGKFGCSIIARLWFLSHLLAAKVVQNGLKYSAIETAGVFQSIKRYQALGGNKCGKDFVLLCNSSGNQRQRLFVFRVSVRTPLSMCG